MDLTKNQKVQQKKFKMSVYKSKTGYKIITFLTLFFSGNIEFLIFQKEPIEAILSVSVIFALVYGLFLYVNFSTKYEITDNGMLKIKCGFFYNKKFDIEKIKKIVKTSNLISSPAPSLDRIELTYGKFETIIISPKNKIEFANQLMKINPKIENKIVE